MRAQVKKWGNSASVRIPTQVMAAAALRVDQEVDIREEAGRVIIEPVIAPAYDLDVLVAALDPATFPDDTDTGPPRAAEIW